MKWKNLLIRSTLAIVVISYAWLTMIGAATVLPFGLSKNATSLYHGWFATFIFATVAPVLLVVTVPLGMIYVCHCLADLSIYLQDFDLKGRVTAQTMYIVSSDFAWTLFERWGFTSPKIAGLLDWIEGRKPTTPLIPELRKVD